MQPRISGRCSFSAPPVHKVARCCVTCSQWGFRPGRWFAMPPQPATWCAMPGLNTGRWNVNYWESKADVEALVRDSGFACYTILKPAFLMENFIPPKAEYMFPDLIDDQLITALRPETRMVLVSAEDVGKAAAAAAAAPERYNRAEIELAGDWLTMGKSQRQFPRQPGARSPRPR